MEKLDNFLLWTGLMTVMVSLVGMIFTDFRDVFQTIASMSSLSVIVKEMFFILVFSLGVLILSLRSYITRTTKNSSK